MTKSNDKKDEIQAKAISLSSLHDKLVLEWATGCGKTLGTIKIVEEIKRRLPNSFGYLICKESNHIKNWEDDIKKHNKEKVFDNIETLLYASLHKVKKQADFIILDEVHALTQKRAEGLIRIIGSHTKIICLSATIPYDKRLLIQFICGKNPHYYKISLMDAISYGLLPVPKVIVHKKTLSNDMNRIYAYNIQKGIKAKRGRTANCAYPNMWKVLNNIPNIDLDVMCNEKEYYDLLTSKMDYHKEQSEKLGQPFNEKIKHRNMYLNFGSQRKKFIAKVKTAKSKEIIQEFRDSKSRFICFTGSIEQSLELGGNSSVNSKNSKEENLDLIDGFNSKMYSELFAVNMLREGMNLTNIEKGLIVQLDSTVGSYFQMMGRMLRHQFPEIHMIKLEGTQDEKYFTKAMEDFDEKFVTYI